MSLGINVTYRTKLGQRQAFLDALSAAGIREAVRQEAGCLKYDYYLSVSEPDQVLLVEQWESREAQQVHLSQPHMARVREIKERLVEETVLNSYEV
mgnify:CR=1 FL=1